MLKNCAIYFFLLGIMWLLTWCSKVSKRNKIIWLTLASLAFAVVMGIRYDVGTDFFSYLIEYESATHGRISQEFNRWELGFKVIFLFFAKGGFHYSFPFGVIAFLQIFFVFYALIKLPKVLPYVTITLILSCIWLSYDNIMRHMMAFSIFVYSVHFLALKQYLKYLCCILLAYFFHGSAIILVGLILPYLCKPFYFSKLWLEIVLFVISFILINVDLVQQIFENLSVVISTVGYEEYMTTSYAEFNEDAKLGLGMLTIMLISLIIIINSNKMKLFYSCGTVNIMYDLYFVGVILRFAFARMFLIQRLNYYFYSFEFIIAALTLAYLHDKKKYLSFYCLLGLFFILFIGKMSQAIEITADYKTFLDR